MRSSKSRSRGKPNRSRTIGNVANRVFDSSGPEGKVRGTPQQIIEKYNQLARDAQLSNDRVAAENFQQHAEHYMRLLSEAQKEMDARREQQEREIRDRQPDREQDRERRSPESHEIHEPMIDPADEPQPEVFSYGEESNLVETPESEAPPVPKKRTYKPRKTSSASQGTAESGSDTANGAAGETHSAGPAEATPAVDNRAAE